MTRFAIKVGDSYWRRRYSTWSGNSGTVEDCTTFKTRDGAEKRAAQLRSYHLMVRGKRYADTICVEEIGR